MKLEELGIIPLDKLIRLKEENHELKQELSCLKSDFELFADNNPDRVALFSSYRGRHQFMSVCPAEKAVELAVILHNGLIKEIDELSVWGFIKRKYKNRKHQTQ